MPLLRLRRHPIAPVLLALVPVAAVAWSASGALLEAPPARHPVSVMQSRGEPRHPPTHAEHTLHRFALNALLATLLDADAAPLRWADPALIPGCGDDTSVLIDGVPLEANALVPAGAFTLTWRLVDCMPFGNASMALAGTVTLQVEPSPGDLTAIVRAERLRIDGRPVAGPLARPFEATLAHAALDVSPR